MKFKFTLQKESLDLLNKILRSVSKFWNSERIFIHCDNSGIMLYPENVTESSPTYCEITLLAPEKTHIPQVEGTIECKQFFDTYLISSEGPNSRIIFVPNTFTEFIKAVSLLASLRLESITTFRLSQEVLNNYIHVNFYLLIS